MASTTGVKTRLEFRTRARMLLNEAVPGLFTDAEMNDWINDGQRDVAFKAKCVETTAALTFAANTKTYVFTAAEVVSIHWNGLALEKITPKQAGHIKENGTDPQFFWTWGTNIYIHPTPAAGITVTTATAFLAGEPDDMEIDSSTSNLPLIFQDLIILYVFYRGLLKAGKFQQAGSVYAIYLRELAFHQTNDSGANKEPDSMETSMIPSRYVQTQGQK